MSRAKDELAANEFAIIALLRDSASALDPDQDTRDRIRQRILTQWGDELGDRRVTPASSRDRRTAASNSRLHGRLAVATVAALCLVLSLASMSLLLSQNALPGDALYAIKRTGETAQLGLTFGDEPKALKRLEFASARLAEIETLATRYGPVEQLTNGYLSTLADFETDAVAGSRLLTTLDSSADGRILQALQVWAEQQNSRLDGTVNALPRAAQSRAEASMELLTRIQERASMLLTRLHCRTVTAGAVDEIGVLPAEGRCVPLDANPSGSASPLPRGTVQQPVTPTTLPATSQPSAGAPPLTRAPSPTAQPSKPGGSNPSLSSTLRPTQPTSPAAQPQVTIPLPLPLPLGSLPPLLPGLPEISLGG